MAVNAARLPLKTAFVILAANENNSTCIGNRIFLAC